MDHLSRNINVCVLSHGALRAIAGISLISVPDNQRRLVNWPRIEDTVPSGCHLASITLCPLGLAKCCVPELTGFLTRLAWLFFYMHAMPSEYSRG